MIPYGRQEVTEEDIRSVVDVLHSNFLTQGPVVPEFEKKLCEYTGADYSVAVNSCTSALHIACLSLGLEPGDTLWTSPITFVASANCAHYCGASVDFVDIEPDTALMSVKKLEEKLIIAKKEERLPKIVIPVSFAGQSCDMEVIYALSQKYGFRIIEDAAHAIGARYKGEPAGNCRYSDITVFSFHPVKIITSGEGGVAMTNNVCLYEKMKLYRSHGITKEKKKLKQDKLPLWHYEQVDIGFNYRMSDIHAALGLSQINRIDSYIKERQKISDYYDRLFLNTSIQPLLRKNDRYSSCHLYVIRVPTKLLRDKIYNHLIDLGIMVNLHYIPVYRHPFYKKKIFLENSEKHYRFSLTLPLYPNLTDSQINRIFGHIDKLLRKI